MKKAELEQAFRAVASQEFSDIPNEENKIQYTFSQRFNKRMEKLIRNQKKVYWHLFNTKVKRVAIVFAILAVLFATACSVKAIREPIVNFVKEVYETFTGYFFEGDTVDQITKEYAITKLPEGFVQTNKIKEATAIAVFYENENGVMIQYQQQITRVSGSTFDIENCEKTSFEIKGCPIDAYCGEDIVHVIWVQDAYEFRLTVFAQMEIDEIKKIIESIK